jgi:hypothetical protein
MKHPFLYHYFERSTGPFRNLSKLSVDEAEKVLNQLKNEGKAFASKRSDDYLVIRRNLEYQAREIFRSKGGKPRNHTPHYMTLGACPWIREWYREGDELKIHIGKFHPETISFTYGDLFPAMRFQDGKPYRGQVYTKDEIKFIIEQYGYPQEWNPDGSKGPERYIEVQIWDDELLAF